jgi:hypothetical protein
MEAEGESIVGAKSVSLWRATYLALFLVHSFEDVGLLHWRLSNDCIVDFHGLRRGHSCDHSFTLRFSALLPRARRSAPAHRLCRMGSLSVNSLALGIHLILVIDAISTTTLALEARVGQAYPIEHMNIHDNGVPCVSFPRFT